MATCNICKYAERPMYKSPCSECKGYSKYEYKQVQTNADRIRAMSDEELAEFIQEAESCGLEGASVADWGMTILEWLRKPVEETK